MLFKYIIIENESLNKHGNTVMCTFVNKHDFQSIYLELKENKGKIYRSRKSSLNFKVYNFNR